jgi:hypothetical protein
MEAINCSETMVAACKFIVVFWFVTPCDQRFGGTYRFHLHGEVEAIRASTYKVTLRHDPEDHFRHFHIFENLKYQT